MNSTQFPIYSLDELLAGMTPQAMHDAFDWGPDVGREPVDYEEGPAPKTRD